MAIRHCLCFSIESSFPKVKKAIRSAILNKGKSLLDFPELWEGNFIQVNNG